MYNITFDTQGGYEGLIQTQWPEGDRPFSPPKTPTHPYKGAYFEGWSLAQNGPLFTDPIVHVLRDITFYAIWSGIKTGSSDIYFKPNGAAGEPFFLTYKSDEVGILPDGSQKFQHPLGYPFLGWATSPTSVNPVMTINPTQDYVLYAIWANGIDNHFVGQLIPVHGRYGHTLWEVPIDKNGKIKAQCPILDQWQNSSEYNPSMHNGAPGAFDLYHGDDLEQTIQRGHTAALYYPEDFHRYHLEPNYYSYSYGGIEVFDINGLHFFTETDFNKYIPPTPRGGKVFKGYSYTFNDLSLEERGLDPVWQAKSVIRVPVFRVGNPQYNVTIEANDGTGRKFVWEKIPNEIVMVDKSFSAIFTPKENKKFIGLATSKNGTPVYGDFITIKQDTTLYCMWGIS